VGGAGIWTFHVIVKIPSLQGVRLLSWFLMSGKKKTEKKATCTWVLGRNHPPKPYHFLLPSPRGIYSLPSYISTRELLDSTIYLDNYMENRALCKSGNACSWLNQNNYHWHRKNNRFPFLDISGYLKNTHKNPKFGRMRQVPTRELGWKFPGWGLSHFAKFGIFMGIL